MIRLSLNGLTDTQRLAGLLAEFVTPGTVICLSGDLGAGKTTFTQSLAAALGITEPVTSPSFTLIHEYHSGKMPLYHMDVYRLDEVSELEDIGFDDYLSPRALVVVEWAERVEELLPGERIHIRLLRGAGLEERIVELPEITALDIQWAEWLSGRWEGIQ